MLAVAADHFEVGGDLGPSLPGQPVEEPEVRLEVDALRGKWRSSRRGSKRSRERSSICSVGIRGAPSGTLGRSVLDLVLRLRGVLGAGEAEVRLGVVGADPASLYYGEAEGEAAGKREH